MPVATPLPQKTTLMAHVPVMKLSDFDKKDAKYMVIPLDCSSIVDIQKHRDVPPSAVLVFQNREALVIDMRFPIRFAWADIP